MKQENLSYEEICKYVGKLFLETTHNQTHLIQTFTNRIKELELRIKEQEKAFDEIVSKNAQ